MGRSGEDGVSTRPTIRDIASLSGVSVATVSRVLNDHPDVSPSTREKVLEHVQSQAYVASRPGRGPSTGRTGLIGLITPYLGGEYFSRIVVGATEALAPRDARPVVCLTYHEHDREASLLSRLMDGSTDGALLILPTLSEAELASVRERAFPIVVIDPAQTVPVGAGIPVVSAASLAGARSVTEHLIKGIEGRRHERIGVITGQMGGLASQQRLAGYRLALAEEGLPFDDDLIFKEDTQFRVKDGRWGAEYLLSLPDPPTAIFAFNDAMAVGVLHEARRRGLRVPEDLAIAGFDNVQIARCAIPRITTVEQPLEELGRQAVDLLYRMIEGYPLDGSLVELSTTLIVGGSTDPSVLPDMDSWD